MIRQLDHLVLVCPDLAAGQAAYSAVLGRAPDGQSENAAAGSATCLFALQNTSLEILAPKGNGPVAERLRDIISDDGPGLKSLVYATDDLQAAQHVLARRGLQPSDIEAGESLDLASGKVRRWHRFRCADAAMAGLRSFVIAHQDAPEKSLPAKPDAVSRLDHIVIETPNPDRAAAIYGARLGLRLALDRTAPQWNTRFLFFRIGDLTVEVVHRLGGLHDPAAPDRLWGLTWQVGDIAAAGHRLADAGLDVSDIRTGRKPGSQVFTLRDGTLGVPTLFIAHEPA